MADVVGSADGHFEQKRAEYYRGSRSTLIDFLAVHRPLTGRALDVGCGEAVLGAELLGRGFDEVVGIEPVSDIAEKARGNVSQIIVSTFQGADRRALGTFDLIIFADSLEHMLDPWTALAETREMLDPDGAVLLSVPNVSHWSVLWSAWKCGRWDYKDEGLLDRTHLRFFTPDSLAKALEAAGFRIVARMSAELRMPKRRRWTRPILALMWPHMLVFQEYVIAVPDERIVTQS